MGGILARIVFGNNLPYAMRARTALAQFDTALRALDAESKAVRQARGIIDKKPNKTEQMFKDSLASLDSHEWKQDA